MKNFAFIALCFAAVPLLGLAAQAETIKNCSKQNPWVYTSFEWAEIDRGRDNSLRFVYGTGDDAQMRTLYFDSPLEEIRENEFQFKNTQYQLDVVIKDSKLSFVLQDQHKSESRKNFICK